ncbi:tryptophan--tRNA ligase [Candidatus Gracilibacteria bacterium]|nr:MAG: tryptophan--tRNA ligase [Candidatus Gracilibacteria bacterium]
MKKIITAVKPTGASMHLANLMGAVLPFEKVAKGNDAAIFIADLHALTSVKDGKTLEAQSLEVAMEYFAIFGIDTPITIFRQSDIVNITKLMWILMNVTAYSLMLRAHSFKDAQNKKNDINMGVFNYPILMAADILGYGIEVVPVGKDQLQHLEMARDIARNFNKTYKTQLFVEPEAFVDKKVATISGTDGRKMGKSNDNFIGIFDDEKKLKKTIASIKTDSCGIDEKKNPDTCTVFSLISVFGEEDEVKEIRKKYESENIGFGYGHAKNMLFDILNRKIKPYREARENLLNHPGKVEARLQEGAKKMNARLDAFMQEVIKITGIK